MCLKKSVNALEEGQDPSDTESEDDEAFKIEEREVVNVLSGNKVPLVKVNTDGYDVVWQPDTAASRDIWSPKQLREYQKCNNQKIDLKESSVKLFAYGGHEPLQLMGQFEAVLRAGKKQVKTDIIVTKEESKHPLLSENTARKLNIISYNAEHMVNKVHAISKVKNGASLREPIRKLIEDNEEVFSGKIGKAPGTVDIMIDPKVRPIVQKGRKIPYHLHGKAEEKLKSLLREDIIEPVPGDEPRTWVSCPVIAPKPDPNQIRFCIDMKAANKAILRPNCMLPSTEDILDKFEGADTFSKLDLKEAYHQFELSHQSRHITTFHGPDRLYRYKRLNYGTRSSQDIMQNEIFRMLAGIPNQVNVADDILVGGTQKEHDEALKQVLDTLKANGITVNPKKCVFDVNSISFLGLIFCKEGIRPDSAKISDLRHADKPKTKEEVRSFLGMSGFSRRFIKDYASITAPLRKASKEWSWGPEQEEAFNKVKKALDENTILHPYKIGAPTQVTVDASPGGLGAVLAQKLGGEWRPVMYKSRSLKDPESRYSQTEREGLAIRWGVKKLRKFLLGGPPFIVITDHKPLVYVFNKGTKDMPPRLERFVMDVQGYDFGVQYKPGKNNVADYLSRHPSRRQGSSKTDEVEAYVNRIVESQYVNVMEQLNAVTRAELKEETEKCEEMKALRIAIRTGDFSDKRLSKFTVAGVQEELHEADGVVYRGTRVVIPISLRAKVVKVGHRGHQGRGKTKSLVREFCWFPLADKMVEQQVQNCRRCQAVTDSSRKPMVKPHDLPSGPWQELEMDLQGPYPTGQYIYALIDRYSKWVEISIYRQAPDAQTVIRSMRQIFDSQGIPAMCQADNGPPFDSEELRRFAKSEGFDLKHVTPEWPRANGEVERFNKTMKAAVQKGIMEGNTIQEAAQVFLRSYRATPHATTEVSPFEAMYNRKMSVGLPTRNEPCQVIDREMVETKQRKMVEKSGGKDHQLNEGDTVLVKQKKRNKFTPRYDPVSYTVRDVKGSMVTARNDRKAITRDGSYFKRIPDSGTASEEEDTAEEGEGRDIPSDEDSQPGEPEQERTVVPEPDAGSSSGLHVPATNRDGVAAPAETSIATGRPKRTRREPAWMAGFAR
jgi:hypothetical protein